jgi:hypothetical protein
VSGSNDNPLLFYRKTPVAELHQSRLDDPGFELKASLVSVLVELHRHPERVLAATD